jgi:hypothetical protein
VSTSIFAPSAPTTDKALNYWKRNLDILLDVTGKEDFPLQERVQANLASRSEERRGGKERPSKSQTRSATHH